MLVISLAQVKVAQHIAPEPPGVHGVPPTAHIPQVPPLQVSPIAQSALVMQLPPADAAVQTPLRHESEPQQSAAPVQRPPAFEHAQ